MTTTSTTTQFTSTVSQQFTRSTTVHIPSVPSVRPTTTSVNSITQLPQPRQGMLTDKLRTYVHNL